VRSQVLVATGIAHHQVATPPRLVWVSVPEHVSGQASRAIGAMRGVAAAAAGSLLIWAVVIGLLI
jgi:hypothetical protein